MSNDIRSLRIKRRIRQKDLAEKIGISLHHIRKWERGLELPNNEAINTLCKLFQVEKNDFLGNQIYYIKAATHGEGYITRRDNKSNFISSRKKPVPRKYS